MTTYTERELDEINPDDALDPREQCQATSAYGHVCGHKMWPPHEVHTCALSAEADLQLEAEGSCGYEWVEGSEE